MGTTQMCYDLPDSYVAVSLYPSSLLKEDEFYCKVARHTVDVKNLIAKIYQYDQSIKPIMLHHAAGLFQRQILEQLNSGYGVNIFDLGVLYIGVDGTVKGKSPKPADIPSFEIRFSPSAMMKNMVKHIMVGEITLFEGEPVISIICDMVGKQENISVTSGKPCFIKGNYLKLGGDVSSISFIQVDDLGKVIPDTNPIVVNPDYIFKNTSSELAFIVPDELPSGSKCRIIITTSYSSAPSGTRKKPVSVESKSLIVN